MAWSGKVLGGVVGAMVGGPLGAGVGAALGHYLADSGAAAKARELGVSRLLWKQHAFSESGPGICITPVWRATGHRGKEVRVRADAGEWAESEQVEIEADDELCELPSFVVPYDGFDGSVRIRLDSRRATSEAATFELPLPSRVRRLGCSGPARVVMALVACARAGDRPLVREDIRFIRETFTAAHPLDDQGLAWLKAWLRELRDAELDRLTPEKVARRLERHLRDDAGEEIVLWLMRGARNAWPGPGAEAWIAGFVAALGMDATRLAGLWRELDANPDADVRARAREVLGVAADATPEAIRDAWRRLVRQWHPDRARTEAEIATATAQTAAINAAWRVLRE